MPPANDVGLVPARMLRAKGHQELLVQHQFEPPSDMRRPAVVAGDGPQGIGQPPKPLLEVGPVAASQALVLRSVRVTQQLDDSHEARREGRVGTVQDGTESGLGLRDPSATVMDHAQEQLAPPGGNRTLASQSQSIFEVREPGVGIDRLSDGESIAGLGANGLGQFEQKAVDVLRLAATHDAAALVLGIPAKQSSPSSALQPGLRVDDCITRM